MNKLPALSLLLLFSGSLLAEENVSNSSTVGEVREALKEKTATPEIKPSNLVNPPDYMPPTSTPETRVNHAPAYSKEQTEALNKEKNWAVEGLKDRREAQRLELEKNQLSEKSSLDELLEKERKSIDARVGKSTSTMGQLKPSIETNWNTVKAGGLIDGEKQLAENKKELEELKALQNSWVSDTLNPSSDMSKDSSPAIDPSFNSANTTFTPMKKEGFTSTEDLQNQLNGTKPKSEQTNYDYLMSTGQAQNFRKLSNDPNFQPESPGASMQSRLSPDASVPSAPKPVNSTMNVETLRQIEMQRVNALPKPDFKELNSRIPSPGTRRF